MRILKEKNMKGYRLLSYPINQNTPLYGDNPPLKIDYERDMQKGDPCNTAIIHLHNHTSTHVDAPKHFSKNGKSITQFSMEELIFTKPAIIHLPIEDHDLLITKNKINPSHLNQMQNCDILIINTGYHQYRQMEKYRTHNPGIGNDFASLIRQEYPNIRCIGLDSLSISSRQHRQEGRKSHVILLDKGDYASEPLLLVEDMDLSGDLSSITKILIVPLFIENVDSMPCTVIAEKE